MSFMGLALNANSDLFDINSKDINAKIEFKLEPAGYPEDITIKGTGLTYMEKKFITFLLGKSSHIDMPGTKTISVEGYHDIYVCI